MARTACQLTSSGTVVTPITFFFQTPFCSFFANKNIGHRALVQDGTNVNKGRHFFVSSDFSLGMKQIVCVRMTFIHSFMMSKDVNTDNI